MSRIGIVVALPQEARMWTTAATARGEPVEVSPELYLAVSGVGGAAARAAALRLLELDCRALVSWGTAGALRPGLHSGQLVVADRIVDADGTQRIPDPTWAQQVLQRLQPCGEVLLEGLAGTEHMLESAQSKEALGARSGAALVDMESAAIARTAAQREAPLLVVRAVVDEIQDTIPPSVAAATDDQGRLSISRLLARLVIRPAEWRAMLRLAPAFARSSRSLTRAAGLLRPDLAFPYP